MPGLDLIYVLVTVIFLEGILSIDNAAVLGAMVCVLPRRIRFPGPARCSSWPSLSIASSAGSGRRRSRSV